MPDRRAAARAAGAARRSSRRRASASANRRRRSTRCAPAGSRRWARRSRPKLCSRRRSARPPARSPNGSSLKSLDRQPRVAQQLRVEQGWERAVETVLGSYLEAVCVDGLDSVTDLLASFDGGHLAVVSTGAEARPRARMPPRACRPRCRARRARLRAGTGVHRRDPDRGAQVRRRGLAAGESVVTRDGIWLGADWLRVSRDAEPHTGVIEREEIAARAARRGRSGSRRRSRNCEHRLELTRERVRDHEDRRERSQAEVNRLHREHVDRRAELDAAQARNADAARRLSQLETELADVRAELARTETDLRAARGRMETAIDALPRSSRSGSSSSRSASACAASWPRRARRRRRRSSGRANWRFRWSRAAPRTPRSSTTLARLEKQLRGSDQRRDELRAAARGRRGAARRRAGELERALALARANRGGAAGRAHRER